MKKRIAYVGLSTPVFYDYKYLAARSKADTHSSPNPILDSPYGLLLLYDEIWFLTRSLCPNNMRTLSYVKFLDEKNEIPDINLDGLHTPEFLFGKHAIEEYSLVSRDYENVRKFLSINWERGQDNHTHGLQIGKWVLNGSSWDPLNVVIDIAIHSKLPKNVEFITNTFTEKLFKIRINSTLNQEKLCHVLTIENIINAISPQGPYHSAVEEARNNQHLINFRNFISNYDRSISGKDVEDMNKEVSEALRKTHNKLISKYFDNKFQFISIGKAILSLVPDFGGLFSFCDLYYNEIERQRDCWQAFLLKDYPQSNNNNSQSNNKTIGFKGLYRRLRT